MRRPKKDYLELQYFPESGPLECWIVVRGPNSALQRSAESTSGSTFCWGGNTLSVAVPQGARKLAPNCSDDLFFFGLQWNPGTNIVPNRVEGLFFNFNEFEKNLLKRLRSTKTFYKILRSTSAEKVKKHCFNCFCAFCSVPWPLMWHCTMVTNPIIPLSCWVCRISLIKMRSCSECAQNSR